MNPSLEIIPEHLQEYITEQDPSLYTPIDHAVWRYVMRVSKVFFNDHGHPLYGHGINATGMSADRVPSVESMDKALRRLGWRAVAINGFIPPAIFLEFQSLRILAIACDIRKIENIGYTPSPDIIHEAAGHAPIVADPGYRAYLEAYGEVARNALITKYDLELYDAILKLSELKENPHSTPAQIDAAQAQFEKVSAQESTPSEAAILTRMAWWTTEYGLIERDGRPVVYGAGLLSSVSESANFLSDSVKRIPFSLEATLKTSYDITRPQPQLFVAKSFEELTKALDQFANTMAFRRGGAYGLTEGMKAENTVTAVLDNGIQLTGIIAQVETNEEGEETSFTLSGTKQISLHDRASEDISTHLLPQKLLIPLFEKNVIGTSSIDLQKKLHGSGLHAKGGLRIQGRFKKEIMIGSFGKILLIEHAKIMDLDGKVVFEEHVKSYPLVMASRVVSVFGGAADRKNFVLKNNQARMKKVSAHRSNLTAENAVLNELYQKVRDFRDMGSKDTAPLEPIIQELNASFPQDWLLRLELLEIFEKQNRSSVFTAQIRQQLKELSEQLPLMKHMIVRGMEIA